MNPEHPKFQEDNSVENKVEDKSAKLLPFDSLRVKIAAKAAVEEHRHKQWERYYNSMSKDAKDIYNKQPLEERQRLFEEWLKLHPR